MASLSSLIKCLCVRPGAYPRMGRLSGALLGWAPGITTSLLPTFVNKKRKKFNGIGGRSYDAIKHKTEKYFAAFVLCEFLNFCVLVSSSENFYSSFRESIFTPGYSYQPRIMFASKANSLPQKGVPTLVGSSREVSLKGKA